MAELVHLVDLGVGNAGSVENMLLRAGGRVQRVSQPAELADAKKVLLPGVGSFDTMVKKLDEAGFRQPLHEYVDRGGHILGICLGMQLLANSSEEGRLPGLGLISGQVRRFSFDGEATKFKVPHMGWNSVTPAHVHPLTAGLEKDARFYFVHSYYFDCDCHEDRLLSTTYGRQFTSGVQKGRVMGVQFHPEKSHRYGMRLLSNFLGL